MLKSAHVKVLASVAHFRGNAMFSDIVGFVEAERGTWMKRLVHEADPVVIHRIQGRVQALSDFLELVEDGPALLERRK